MIALPLSFALALTLPMAPSPCSDLPVTSTLAEQFTCYKDAGRRVILPGTDFIHGFNGPGCIVGVGADRIQISTCSGASFNRVTVMVPYASIRAVEDDASQSYITILQTMTYVRNDCLTVDCTRGEPARAPRPAPAPPPPAIATPKDRRP